MLQIQKYCGRERLPGGTRRWKRLARAAGYAGLVRVYGFGVKGEPGKVHRRAARSSADRITWADFEPGLIRVWVECSCGVALDDMADEKGAFDRPDSSLGAFAHELGHHRLHAAGKKYHNEAVAERYGRMLLRSVN